MTERGASARHSNILATGLPGDPVTGPLAFQNVRFALSALEADPVYQEMKAKSADRAFHRFRQSVELTGIRCLMFGSTPPTAREIEGYLSQLHKLTVGPLAHFRPFIARAQAALR